MNTTETEPETIDPEQQHAALVRSISARQRERLADILSKMDVIESILMRLPDSVVRKASIILDTLDLDHLERNEVLSVLSVLESDTGRWEKTQNISEGAAALDYSAEVNGVRVRLWAAAPPGTCRVVEVEEEIPARKVTRRKLVCSE